MTPLVSILIPVYNRVQLIQETVAAACAQTYPSFEVVVSDNASTDGTWELLSELAAREPRLRIFRHDENLGPVRNWLSCVERANGEIAKILWSDDLMSADFLAQTVPYLAHVEVGFAYTATRMFEGSANDQNAGAILYDDLPEGLHDTLVYIEGALIGTDFPFSPGCAIFRMTDLRRNLWLEVPNRVGSDFSQHAIGNDLLVFLLTAALYPRFAVIRSPLAQFRAHGGSISVASAAGRLPLHYDIARAAFVERTPLSERIVRRFNAKLWSDLKRYDGSAYGLFRVSDFYPTLAARAAPLAIAAGLIRQVRRKLRAKWLGRLHRDADAPK